MCVQLISLHLSKNKNIVREIRQDRVKEPLSRVVIHVISEIQRPGSTNGVIDGFFDDFTSANSAKKSVDSRSFSRKCMPVRPITGSTTFSDYLQTQRDLQRRNKAMKIYDIFNVREMIH